MPLGEQLIILLTVLSINCVIASYAAATDDKINIYIYMQIMESFHCQIQNLLTDMATGGQQFDLMC